MSDTTSIKCVTFGDMISIVENRAKIAGTVQDRVRNQIKGLLNEHYVNIGTERNWYWRKFDRSFVFDRAITTGTAAVTSGSREIVYTGRTVDQKDRGKTVKIVGKMEMYRIIGVNTSSNSHYIDCPYVGDTETGKSYKLYQYEFPLPPDCDTITQLYFDSAYEGLYGKPDMTELDVMQFNRLMSMYPDTATVPFGYCRESKIPINTLPPLDSMILNYDFLLGDEDTATVDKLRLFPLEPDQKRVIHINYSKHINEMNKDDEEPLIPVDNRWVLVNLTLSDFFALNGQNSTSDRYLRKANDILNRMRSEYIKTDVKPRFIYDPNRNKRSHDYGYSDYLFIISRANENG